MSERPVLLSGNEAVARGAYEAGARLIAGYPGTPSTEIIQSAVNYPELYCEWSSNEKVAMEVAIGAALGGAWAMASMKHVGLNVASDPLMTVSYMDIPGALVVVSADDPGMWSSQNEQDNRTFARFARIPVFEPSDSQEAKDMTMAAFELSHEFGVPVLIRITTRLAHTRCPVVPGQRRQVQQGPRQGERIKLNPQQTVMIPAHARARHPVVEERLLRLASVSQSHPTNYVENAGAPGPAFVASGIPYQYVKEAFPGAPVLKLGMSYPLPQGLIEDFCNAHHDVIVVEELDPLVETEILALGYQVRGKVHSRAGSEVRREVWDEAQGEARDEVQGELHSTNLLPRTGEYNSGMLTAFVTGKDLPGPRPESGLPPRPPQLCPGCPHRGVFHVLAGLNSLVFGDIGCYTLGVMKPLEALHSCTCMGASIGHAHGLEKALGKDTARNTVAVIGDSTFFHSGIPSLLNASYNSGSVKLVILDNRTTAMTGHQGNPGSGLSARLQPAPEVDLVALVTALGISNVSVVDPYDLKATKAAIGKAMSCDGPAVVIARRECALLKTARRNPPVTADTDLCRKCGFCFKLGCPAMYKVDGKARVDPALCNGCSMCVQVCPFDALKEARDHD